MRTSDSGQLLGARRVLRRIALTVATGSITFVLTNLTNQPLPWTLTLSVLIGGITLLAQFLIDFERREEQVERRMSSLEFSNATVAQRLEETVKQEVSRLDESARLLDRLTDSALHADSIQRLVRLSADLPEGSLPLAVEVAQAQVDAAVSFLEQLGHGEVGYDGEDRDWLLTLTKRSRHTISATSRGTVSADGDFIDDGFWDSELGHRYLDAQREAVRRGVAVRRIFVLEDRGIAHDPDFRKLCDQQRSAGVSIRILDAFTLTPTRALLLPDMVIFDDEISYELTTGPRLVAASTPYFLKTMLHVRPDAVRNRVQQFNDYWELSEPYERTGKDI